MWMLRHKRFVIALAACSAALALTVGCSDEDAVTPIGEGGAGGAAGSSSAGKGGNAAAGHAGAARGGASGAGVGGSGDSTAGTAGEEAGAAGTGTGGSGGSSAGSGGKGGTAGVGGTTGGSGGTGGKGGSGGTSAGAGGGGGIVITGGSGGTAGVGGAVVTGGSGGTAGGSAGAGGTSGTAGSSGAATGGNGGSAGFTPVSITVLNAGFETGDDNAPAQNWQSTGNTAASYVHYNQASTHSGYGYLAFYSNAAFTVDTSQTINGLNNGTYEFSAWIEGGTPVTIYANNYSSAPAETKSDLTLTSSYVKYTVTGIPVTNGKITIGFRTTSTASAGAWANIDDVTLTRIQ